MTFLDLFFLFSAIGILSLAFKMARKDHFRWLHVWIFVLGGMALLCFTFLPELRDYIGRLLGVERGADALVYISIVVLSFFVLILLHRSESQRQEITRLVREIAISNACKKDD